MVDISNIKKYFPEFDNQILADFQRLAELYIEWNQKINVISRKDIENIVEHHIIHALSLLKFIELKKGSTALDVGTGGGIPGIPMAIIYPEIEFTLLDSRNKKVLVANEIAAAMKLSNVRTIQTRVEDYHKKYDYVLGRAVTEFSEFKSLVKKNLKNPKVSKIIYWTGGDVMKYKKVKSYSIFDKIDIEHFQEKFILCQ
jgi:16S rRNA (guanine527-N7)-methyltransferase